MFNSLKALKMIAKGDLHIEASEYKEAIECYDKAFEINPKYRQYLKIHDLKI